MLEIQFKECCRKCKHVDVESVDTILCSAMNRKPETRTRIFCRHAVVCKTYLESDEPWQGKSQT